jgi:hypothetical protein
MVAAHDRAEPGAWRAGADRCMFTALLLVGVRILAMDAIALPRL